MLPFRQYLLHMYVFFFPDRWLQPDRAVDAEASVLVLPTEPPVNGLPSEFSVTTRDQDGEKVFVGDMKV